MGVSKLRKTLYVLSTMSVLLLAGCGQQAVVNHHGGISTASKQTGYNYKKLLGFQPLLPAKVPSGYTLKNIQTEMDTGAKVGNMYSFTASYQNENSYFRVWEAKTTEPTTVPSFAQKVTLDGISGMWYEADGSNFQFKRDGIIYRIEGGNLTSEQVQEVASNLSLTAARKPDHIVKHALTQ